MYNTDLPTRAELPSSAQLRRSTLVAGLAATAILALVVLPSEYAVDPTGVGSALGLTQMGAIKMQLAQEAETDAAAASAPATSSPDILARLDRIENLLRADPAALPASVQAAPEPLAATEAPAEGRFANAPSSQEAEPQAETAGWRDEMSFPLAPGQGVEVKLVMEQGAQADYFWTANGSVVNYETHGDGGGNSVSYEKGRSVAEQEGVLTAAFTGNHGWFWRNRTDAPLSLTLRTRGAYSVVKPMM